MVKLKLSLIMSYDRHHHYDGHCVVCPSSIDGFWLPLWYLQTLHSSFGISVSQVTTDVIPLVYLCWFLIKVTRWMPLVCLSFFDLPLLITTLCKMATNCNFREKGYTRQNNLILFLELQCNTLISINYMTCILWSKESFMDIKLNTCLKTGPDYPIG